MKKHIISIIASLLAGVTALSLIGCKYEDPDLSEYGVVTGEDGKSFVMDETPSPYGMYDYSLRAFHSGYQPVVYKSDVYITDGGILSNIPLSSLDCDLRTATEETHHLPESYSVCPDSTHKHDGELREIANECPAHTGDTSFLIDAYESAGGYPIFYYATYNYGEYDLKGEWVDSHNLHILRYDSGAVKRQHIVELTTSVEQMMTYGDKLFFITQSAEGEYELNSIGKDGKDRKTRSFGNEKITMIDVYDGKLLLRDSDATIYTLSFDLADCEEVLQIEEDLTMSLSADGFETVFTHDGYLYYCDDFATVEYQPSADHPDFLLNLLTHSVRRLPLSDLSGESELVAENIFDDHMYGISNNVFYYAPCEPIAEIPEYNFNYTSGKLMGVDLDTLETVVVQEDCGFHASPVPRHFMQGDGLFAMIFFVREGYFIEDVPVADPDNTTNYYCIFDIKTGALYTLGYY